VITKIFTLNLIQESTYYKNLVIYLGTVI